MMAETTDIPVINLSAYGLHVTNPEEVDKQILQTTANKICRALTDIGFCYISNHGIPQSRIDDFNAISMDFFRRPEEYKKKFEQSNTNETIQGWGAPGTETLDPSKPEDHKELFHYVPKERSALPDIPKFETTMMEFYKTCQALGLRVLDLISIGLYLEDRDLLRKFHAFMGGRGNSTTLRNVLYLPLPEEKDPKMHQLWCGEHSDFGSITLLFQDEVGGLEVCNREGRFVPATPIPGTVVINIGDLMQRWTADKLIATRHRVVIPTEDSKRKKCRQSIVFFMQPDDDVMIECLDKSQKYKPISSLDYLMERFDTTY